MKLVSEFVEKIAHAGQISLKYDKYSRETVRKNREKFKDLKLPVNSKLGYLSAYFHP